MSTTELPHEDTDNESSGFGDFCGFDLEEDLSEDSHCDDDELERPGKTYEYVNFVDPKYAEQKRKASHKSINTTHSTKRSLTIVTNILINAKSASPTPPSPRSNFIPEDKEENPPHPYHGHIHNHSIHQHTIQSTTPCTTLQRHDTTSEIAAEHGVINGGILNNGRRSILNSRRTNRRYVWKDAEKYDILCVVASPCVKPTHIQLTQPSQGSHEPSISYRELLIKTKTVSISINNNDLDILATVDDGHDHEHKPSYERNSYLFEKHKASKKHSKKHKKRKKRKKKSSKKKKNTLQNRDSKSIAASDSLLLYKHNYIQNKSHPKMQKNKSVDFQPTEPQSHGHGLPQPYILQHSHENDIAMLQHFDIKGLQTLLYDGILCSIHQTARFLTLGGTVSNALSQLNGCKLLHYIGYAFDGKLLLESDDDVGLGQLFEPCNKNIIDRMTQCVVVQSPTHLEVANIFLTQLKVKHVVAIRQVDDNFAHHITDFITQFYFALIESNTTIARAFRTAFKLFDDSNYMHQKYRDTIYDDFKLLPENVDHELILFRDGLFDHGKPRDYTRTLSPHNNLHAIRPFIGRWNDVYKVMNMIRDKKLSIICSDQPGCGRTAIITMAARYLWKRRKFKGGVFHIKNNFDTKRIRNLAELVLDTLDVAEVHNFHEIAQFYDQIRGNPLYVNKSHLLAVELLYKYVCMDEAKRPICLLFSDFDEIEFDAVDKFSFICALIERFDDEMENPPDIGTRIVITCVTKFVSQIQYYMDRIYKSMPTEKLPAKYITNYFHNGNTHSNGRVRGGSEPAPLHSYSKYSKLPMQYKRGHQVIKPLTNDDLVHLFLQMINIASTETIYKFNNIIKHKALLTLFDYKPFKVKQVAEYVLQTFDDNLSRQQFQYEETGDAEYGLIYEFEDESDSHSESEDEAQHTEDADDIDMNTSKLELDIDIDMDQFSDYAPKIDENKLSILQLQGKSIRKIKSYESFKSVKARLSNTSTTSYNLSRGSFPFNDSIDYSTRKHSLRETNAKSYKVLPADAYKQSKRILLGSTIVPSGDCSILLTANANSNLSSRNFCVDMAITSLDYKKTFIRQKIQRLHKSFEFAPYSLPDVAPLQEIASGVGMDEFKISNNKSTQHLQTLSTKLSRPKLRFTNESIPINHTQTNQPHNAQASAEVYEADCNEDLGDKIKAAWPDLDAIVEGFRNLEDERMIQEHINLNNSKKHNQRRFANMDAHRQTLGDINVNAAKLEINVSSPRNSIFRISYSAEINHEPPFVNPNVSQSYDATARINTFECDLNGRTVSSNYIIDNEYARQIWNENGGNGVLGTVCLLEGDLMADLYNYWTDKTRNKYLIFDKQSIGPLFRKFVSDDDGHGHGRDRLEITAGIFAKVWKWFDCLCDIVNETRTFWNNKIARNHGFITRENAERELQGATRPFGTFIVRFTAPKPDIVITYKNNPITHVRLIRTNNCDLYQNANPNNYQRDRLKMWIQRVPEFKYIFTKFQSLPKQNYF